MGDWGDDEAVVGSLIFRRGKWITLAPTHCPHGHELGRFQTLVGHVACMGHGGGGHTIWHCLRCPREEPPTFGPPLNTHCTVLVGPAKVRISSSGPSSPLEGKTEPSP